jgi:hypothetical protein
MSFWNTVRTSLFGPETGPLPHGSRSDLDSSLRNTTAHQPFTKALGSTNRRHGISGDNTLQAPDQKRYSALAEDVESHRVSNSFAFGSSSAYWAKQGKWGGAGLNAAGLLFSGVIDAQNYKRGRGWS